MNILIYNLEARLSEVIRKVGDVSGVHVFFACSREDARMIAEESDPHIIFTNSVTEGDRTFIIGMAGHYPLLDIYDLQNTAPESDLVFKNLRTNTNRTIDEILNRNRIPCTDKGQSIQERRNNNEHEQNL